MEITFKENKKKTNSGHRTTESISSTVSIESKGKNIIETLTGLTGLINSESITRFIVKNKEELNAKNEVRIILIECDWTPLYRTIIYEKEKATENLLKMGADPNIRCNVDYNLFRWVRQPCTKQLKWKKQGKLTYFSDGKPTRT
jgi:hypothetical protein